MIFAPHEPRRRQRISLRSRVTLLAAICVAGAVALVSFGAYLTVQQNLYDQVDQNLRDRATNALNAPSLDFGDTNQTTVDALVQALSDVKFTIIDASGRQLIKPPGMLPSYGAEERSVAAGVREEHFRTDPRSDSRVFSIRIAVGDRPAALVVAQRLQPTKQLLNDLALVLVLISGAGVVVAALAGTAVARTGLRPVERLTRATERVARTGDLRPIQVSGDDELARLTHSFNTMLGAVSDARDRQRSLVADAGHELRTPLTSLRTNLELLMASEAPGAPTLSDEDKAEIQDDLRGQLDELTTLIGDLVELAREEGTQAVWEPVELVEVVEQALDRARRRAGEIQFDVSLQPWRLIGDAGTLERAVLNLLDNAVKFSPPDGIVRVRLGSAGDGFAVLEVADQGPGIADEDLPRVFDRFYRSQEARTLPGSGLGLAIVQQAALRHGGEVLAGRSPEGGALFSLRLPGMPG
ncbi:HAMP domain-containing sensor histidine kinase [Kibdelosporangium persicum]|uniref:histidine kinase n=1 Tax=Kibdelosporangium persicum TaxID=2698649 RepID=A0ABX2FH59_9PSEU|nr:HAMP domain-containing sensor histidine kinase [Kibdelosporangium persicum]NRN70720.1 Integral membrane sensor signal transduction histidine kinase [Kibdelosporangium persicum]